MQVLRFLANLLDSAIFWILSYYSVKIFLFNWYVEIIVSLICMYTIIAKTQSKVMTLISKVQTILKITNIIRMIFPLLISFFMSASPITFVTIELPKLLKEKLGIWVKSIVIKEIKNQTLPFIQKGLMAFIKMKLNDLIAIKIKENKKTIILCLIGIPFSIIIYIVSCFFWKLRLIINVVMLILILIYLYRNFDLISNWHEKYEAIIRTMSFIQQKLLPTECNRYFLFYVYCYSYIKETFKGFLTSYNESHEICSGKSFASQTNFLIISLFPFLVFVRYLTSNILWFLSIFIGGIVFHLIVHKPLMFYLDALQWFSQKKNEFIIFLYTLEDISEDIKKHFSEYAEKITDFLNSFTLELGKCSGIYHCFDSIRQRIEAIFRHDNDDNANATKESQNEKDEDKKNEESNQPSDDQKKIGEDASLFQRFYSFVEAYQIQISISIIAYVLFQNLFYVYLHAVLYSIILFAFYSVYQYFLEKVSRNKFNYYSIMWMFSFLNRQIIVLRLWIQFFGYESFMLNSKPRQFHGYTILQMIYIAIQSIRIVINSIEIIYYIKKKVSRRTRSEDIISTMIFPF